MIFTTGRIWHSVEITKVKQSVSWLVLSGLTLFIYYLPLIARYLANLAAWHKQKRTCLHTRLVFDFTQEQQHDKQTLGIYLSLFRNN